MQITRAGEYGVLGLMALAKRAHGSVVMIDEVSREEDIPKSFLAKIFQNLARAGLVHSVRGTGGGFALAKSTTEISVLDIIEAIEGPIALQRCLEEKPECNHLPGCALCGLFSEAQDRLKETFAQTSLAELVRRQERLPTARGNGARVLVTT
jgi:Rrf2 family transcriptional regulator, iron-sulfur cluster assembly transcription factor